jgi:glycerophosphoryl diester phosphodiesterase
LLLERLAPDWLGQAQRLACAAVVCHHPLWTAEWVSACQANGLRTLAYTVNDPASVQRLTGLGLDGLITDRVDVFAP